MPDSNVRNYLNERFGVEPEGEFYYNGDYWYCRQPDKKYETNGIRAVREMNIGLKPTTYFLQLLGPELEKNVVNISGEELEVLEEGGMIQRDMESKGYVALKYEDRVLGCGFYMDGLVSSRIPEGRFEELIKTL
ncbi:MAG: hypothetical protein ACLFTA_02320 [Candidatus Nanohaloarchaea archaeon]